jgi:hypothetical protein
VEWQLLCDGGVTAGRFAMAITTLSAPEAKSSVARWGRTALGSGSVLTASLLVGCQVSINGPTQANQEDTTAEDPTPAIVVGDKPRPAGSPDPSSELPDSGTRPCPPLAVPPARRLTRTEYLNAIEDIFQVAVESSELPEDIANGWFDNNHDSLTFNSELLESYLRLAESITTASEQTIRSSLLRLCALSKPITDASCLEKVMAHWGRKLFRRPYTAEEGASLHESVATFEGDITLPSPELGLRYDDFRAVLGSIKMTAGGSMRFFENASVEATVTLPRPGQRTVILTARGELGGNACPIAQVAVDGVIVAEFKICSTGAYAEHSLTTSFNSTKSTLAVIYPNDYSDDASDRNFNLKDVKIRETAEDHRRNATSFVSRTVELMLSSPHFLFVDLHTRDEHFRAADALALALWRSAPDQGLLDLAQNRQTLDRDALWRQVDRMIDDPKFVRFARDYGLQWLGLKHLTHKEISAAAFPGFQRALLSDMQSESALFLTAAIREGLTFQDLLTADFTFVNRPLSAHYGLSSAPATFERVSLAATPRRGVLGHASFLTGTSHANQTSIVGRGNWVLDRLLCSRVPDPPAGIDTMLPESPNSAASRREILESHRKSASCMGCHQLIDPIGFGLENFDAIGRWRTVENGAPIDSAGVLPGGASFRTPKELGELLSHDSRYGHCATRSVFSFVFGKEPGEVEECHVRAFADALTSQRASIRSVLEELIQTRLSLGRSSMP